MYQFPDRLICSKEELVGYMVSRLRLTRRDVVIIVPTMDLQGNYKDTFARGAEVRFNFSGSVCHLFDSEGKNLEF